MYSRHNCPIKVNHLRLAATVNICSTYVSCPEFCTTDSTGHFFLPVSSTRCCPQREIFSPGFVILKISSIISYQPFDANIFLRRALEVDAIQLNCNIFQNSWIWRLDSLLVVALAVTTLSWVGFVKGALGRNPRYFVYSSMRIAFAVLFWAFHSIQTFELLNFVENDILSLNKLPDLLIAVLGSNSSPDTGTSSHPCGSSMS